MGQSKRQRKKYKTPPHPWNKARIVQEAEISAEYGLVNKKEIQRAESVLRNFKRQAKELTTRSDVQAEVEWKQLAARLNRLGLVSGEVKLEQVLDLSLKDILERRLQTQAVRKGLARNMMQSRQLIVHRHVMVDGAKLAVPGHLVTVHEENLINFAEGSPFADPNHPERLVGQVVEEAPEEEAPKKKAAKKEVAEEVTEESSEEVGEEA